MARSVKCPKCQSPIPIGPPPLPERLQCTSCGGSFKTRARPQPTGGLSEQAAAPVIAPPSDATESYGLSEDAPAVAAPKPRPGPRPADDSVDAVDERSGVPMGVWLAVGGGVALMLLLGVGSLVFLLNRPAVDKGKDVAGVGAGQPEESPLDEYADWIDGELVTVDTVPGDLYPKEPPPPFQPPAGLVIVGPDGQPSQWRPKAAEPKPVAALDHNLPHWPAAGNDAGYVVLDDSAGRELAVLPDAQTRQMWAQRFDWASSQSTSLRQPLYTFPAPERDAKPRRPLAALNADGGKLAVEKIGGAVGVWNEAGVPVGEVGTAEVRPLGLHWLDTDRLVIADAASLSCWRVGQAEPLWRRELKLLDARPAPAGDWLAALAGDGLHAVDPATGQDLAHAKVPTGTAGQVAVAPTGTQVAAVAAEGENQRLIHWDAAAGTVLAAVRNSIVLADAAAAPHARSLRWADATRLVVLQTDSHPSFQRYAGYLYDTADHKLKGTLGVPEKTLPEALVAGPLDRLYVGVTSYRYGPSSDPLDTRPAPWVNESFVPATFFDPALEPHQPMTQPYVKPVWPNLVVECDGSTPETSRKRAYDAASILAGKGVRIGPGGWRLRGRVGVADSGEELTGPLFGHAKIPMVNVRWTLFDPQGKEVRTVTGTDQWQPEKSKYLTKKKVDSSTPFETTTNMQFEFPSGYAYTAIKDEILAGPQSPGVWWAAEELEPPKGPAFPFHANMAQPGKGRLNAPVPTPWLERSLRTGLVAEAQLPKGLGAPVQAEYSADGRVLGVRTDAHWLLTLDVDKRAWSQARPYYPYTAPPGTYLPDTLFAPAFAALMRQNEYTGDLAAGFTGPQRLSLGPDFSAPTNLGDRVSYVDGGKTLLMADDRYGSEIEIWDPLKAEKVRSLGQSKGPYVGLSPDRSLVMVRDEKEPGKINVISTATFEPVGAVALDPAFTRVQLSADNTVLAAADGQLIHTFTLTRTGTKITGMEVRHPPVTIPGGLDADYDWFKLIGPGDALIYRKSLYNPWIIDAATGTVREYLGNWALNDKLLDLTVRPDGGQLAVASGTPAPHDGGTGWVALFDPVTASALLLADRATAVDVPLGAELLDKAREQYPLPTANEDWSLYTPERGFLSRATVPEDWSAPQARFTEDGGELAVVTGNGFKVFGVAGGNEVFGAEPPGRAEHLGDTAYPPPARAYAIDPAGRQAAFVYGSHDGKPYIGVVDRDRPDKPLLIDTTEPDGVQEGAFAGAAFSPDGRRLYSIHQGMIVEKASGNAFNGFYVRVTDLRKGKLDRKSGRISWAPSVQTVQAQSTGKLLFYDTLSGFQAIDVRKLAPVDPPAEPGPKLDLIAVSADGRRLAGAAGTTAYVYPVPWSAKAKPVEIGLGSVPHALALAPDGKRLYALTQIGGFASLHRLAVFDAKSGQELASLPVKDEDVRNRNGNLLPSLAVSDDGGRLAIVGGGALMLDTAKLVGNAE